MDGETVIEAHLRLRGETHELCESALGLLEIAWEGFRKQNLTPLQPAERLVREIHRRATTLTEHAVKQATGETGAPGEDQGLLFIPMHLERIGDNIEFLVRAIATMVQEGIPFTERAMREVNTLFAKAVELLECMRDLIRTNNLVLMRYIVEEGQRYEERANQYALVHEQRLIEGVCAPKAASMYLAILDYLKGAVWHTREIARKLVPGGCEGRERTRGMAV